VLDALFGEPWKWRDGSKKKGPKPVPALERFHRHYIPEPNSGCWLWTATLCKAGYGDFHVPAMRESLAHRFAYKMLVGPIPKGLTVDHKCNVKICVNPDHLRLMTRGQNTSRYYAEMTHCRTGHEYTEENTWFSKEGHRQCRICSRRRDKERVVQHNAYSREYQRKKRARLKNGGGM
jgi:HNH endonuclease